MARMYKLTHQRLVEVLDFDPATGFFTWKVRRSNRVKIGSRAGVLHIPSGGRYISIDNEKFMAHRLAWFYVHAAWPNTDVRPTDGNYDNCALSNLVEVPRVLLARQRNKQRNNSSGYLGVSRTNKGKWQASITWNYKQVNLGTHFETPEAASEVYQEAARRLENMARPEDLDSALEDLRIWRGQKTAWSFLNRNPFGHSWPSFEVFCADVIEVPVMRYAMIPIDAAKPIGPENFRWAFPPEATRTTPEGIRAHNQARNTNRDYYRALDFRKNYGIEFADYQRMLIEQKGVCAICDKPETKLQHGSIRLLSVDHNHETGAVRGLLCASCNLGIGYLCDDPNILRAAIAYLRKHSGESDNVHRFEPAVINGTLGTGA